MTSSSDRGRLTLTDVVFYLLAVVALRALWPVLDEQLQAPGGMDQGTLLLFQTMLPLAIIILIAVVWVKSASTGSRQPRQ